MVEIEEMDVESTSPPPSKERLLDADEIEKAAEQVARPTAKMHLTALAKKLRKEGEALKRVEGAQSKKADQQQNVDEPSRQDPPVAAAVDPPRQLPTATPTVAPTAKYSSVDRFSFDAGDYNSQFVTLYVPMPGVGSIPRDGITCDFTKGSFNLIIKDLNGKNYRLFKDNLEKDIVPGKSKCIVKADKVVIKLAKVKGEYGSYDYWSKLTDPAKKDKKKSDDPGSSIMSMMKEMYDSGDDNMKKMIGETMMKQRSGELGKDAGMGGMGMGGLNDDEF